MRRVVFFFTILILFALLSACGTSEVSDLAESLDESNGIFFESSDVSAEESPDESADESVGIENSDDLIFLPKPPEPEGTGMLYSIKLLSKDNVTLAKDVEFVVDEQLRCAVLKLDYKTYVDQATLSRAVVRVESEGGEVRFSNQRVDGSIDLLSETWCEITDENGIAKKYAVVVDRAVYSLPIVNITLSDGVSVGEIDRNLTTEMIFSLDCTGVEGITSLENVSGTIRGRGNSTWKWEKKPYKIKLDEKAALLGLDDNRDWILLANYADKSLIRNTLAYELGRVLDALYWTPHSYPVDLFVNGEYQGVYAIGEHMEVASGRVDIEEGSTEVDTDYFLEVGGMAPTGDINGVHYFHTNSLLVRFATFKSPDYQTITNEQKKYIKDYFEAAEKAIQNGEGYEEYIDVDSFVDWIILHELSYNIDSCFRRSCFILKEKGGKIKMGPVWDFDLAFGNFSYDNKKYNDLATYGSDEKGAYVSYNWCTYLLRDEEFCARLTERWNELKDEIIAVTEETIDTYGTILDSGSQQKNFEVWDIWDKRAGFQSKWCSAENSFEKQLNYLENFVKTRADWLDKELKKLPKNCTETATKP